MMNNYDEYYNHIFIIFIIFMINMMLIIMIKIIIMMTINDNYDDVYSDESYTIVIIKTIMMINTIIKNMMILKTMMRIIQIIINIIIMMDDDHAEHYVYDDYLDHVIIIYSIISTEYRWFNL